ncbi:MAG: PASTA domain-containing protein [Gemmatimonas sp.]|nr:PASTA domain-containing protein [Gemmatimonas sp.]
MSGPASARVRRSSTSLKVSGSWFLVAMGAFAIGYLVSALSFRVGAAASSVVLVPDVREMQVEDAEGAMTSLGLEVEVGDSFPNPNVPGGAVLAQTPLPGEEVSPGAAVRLIISTGRPRPVVPDIDAMPISLATRALETAGFEVLVEQDSTPGDSGRVVGVDPPPGTSIPLPATVRLRVGGGYEIVEMPTLIGMPERTAREMLTEIGLAPGGVAYEDGEFGQAGKVVGQVPEPGDSVATGTSVDLRVNTPRPLDVFDGNPGGADVPLIEQETIQ